MPPWTESFEIVFVSIAPMFWYFFRMLWAPYMARISFICTVACLAAALRFSQFPPSSNPPLEFQSRWLRARNGWQWRPREICAELCNAKLFMATSPASSGNLRKGSQLLADAAAIHVPIQLQLWKKRNFSLPLAKKMLKGNQLHIALPNS